MTPIQEKELEIVKVVVSIIEKHNLKYFSIGGTTLGAVRHKGFIPWDDDIDIALPRKDYEQLRKILPKELPSNLQFLDYDNIKGNIFMFSKVHDINTSYIADYTENCPEFYTGVFVDIMPLDGMVRDFSERVKIIKHLRHLLFLNIRVRPLPSRVDTPIKKVKYLYRRILRLFFRYNYFSNALQRYAEKWDFYTSDCVCYDYYAEIKDAENRVVFEREDFDEIIKMPFETIEINVPKGYDRYLKTYFGDYMKLPPVEQQVSHGTIICDLNTPCAYYAEKKAEELRKQKVIKF